MKYTKTLLSIMIFLMIIISPFSVYADYTIDGYENIKISETVHSDGEWFYELDDYNKTATIYAYNGKSPDAVIPEVVENDYKVTKLSFASECITIGGLMTSFPVFNTQIKSLIIPKTLEIITRTKDERYYEDDLDRDVLEDDGRTIIWPYFYCKHIQNLESITVDPENPYFSSEGGVLFNKNKTVLISYPRCKKGEKYIVPNTVTRIMNNAFSLEISNLKEVVIPKSVKEIGRKNYFNNDVTVTVYNDSPAYERFAGREKIIVLDNPYAEKGENTQSQKVTSDKKKVKDTSSKVESAVSERTEPQESAVSETEEIPIAPQGTDNEVTAKNTPEKSQKVWVVVSVAAAVILAGGGTACLLIKRKKKE